MMSNLNIVPVNTNTMFSEEPVFNKSTTRIQ